MEVNDTLTEICGVAESVTFHNEETGFTVLELISDDEMVTVVGEMPEIFPGEELNLRGTWGSHPVFGRQFKVQYCERSLPASTDSILKYLSSGAIKGIGPATASRIVEKFGESTLEIMETEPVRLAEIKGISKDKAAKIGEAFRSQFGIRETMMFLSSFGVTPNESLRVWKRWGTTANDRIKENPYILCGEGVGIGFVRADEIAAAMELQPDCEYRVKAGLVYVLRHNLLNGHTCLPLDKLIDVTSQMLDVGQEQIREICLSSVELGELVCDTIGERVFVFLPVMYKAECYCAGRLKLMLDLPAEEIKGADEEIDAIEERSGIKYAELQRTAIEQAMKKGMLVLTGGPGTGKTTTLNAIIDLLELHNANVAISAPTGRAAKRLTEITGREAKTIHRLLEAEYTGDERSVFQRDERNPLDCDALIVDELSMTDSLLFDSLLRALPMRCRLIMVGDSDQLPSVGAGNVLHDMIESGVIPVVQLTEVFRQAKTSAIVTNAHRIVDGMMPDLRLKDNDFFFITANQAMTAQQKIVDLCTRRLPNAYQYDPMKDIQVLAPGKKGAVGTIELNVCLQAVLNPEERKKAEITVNHVILREGDKVMQMKNNYDITWTADDGKSGSGVYNGDVGILKRIDKFSGILTVRFEDREALYPIEDASNLDLAYAMTVHKSQGSEFEAVVMPVYPGPPQLYFRNLLYTAVTRAKAMIVLVGLQSTVQKMVDNNKKTNRYTGLTEFLRRNEDA